MDRIKQFEPIFGEWYVESFIGAGSFGRVYKIYREELGNRFYSALKHISIPTEESELNQLRADGMDDTSISNYYNSLAKSISAETTLMNKLRGNTNIVSFEDSRVIAKHDGIGYDIFIRMELLESLTARIAKAPLSEDEVVRLGRDIGSALVLCSSKGIIHRDIKPDNIFISAEGAYKLGDFGIARQLEKTATFMSKKGTYNYMAPEVYKGEQYGAQCDIYSLGIVMYRLLNNGRLPLSPAAPQQILPDDRESALVRRMRGDAFPPPCNASPELSKIVLKACAFKPKNRYANAAEMLDALKEYRSAPTRKRSKSGNARPAAAPMMIRNGSAKNRPMQENNIGLEISEKPRKPRKGLVAGIAAALLALGVVAALALSGVFGNANKVKGRGKQAMNSAEPTFSAAPGETEADLADEPDGTAYIDGQTHSPDPTRTDLPYPNASGEHIAEPTNPIAGVTPAPTGTAIPNITPAPTSRPTSIPTNAPTGTPAPVVSPTPRITAAPTPTPRPTAAPTSIPTPVITPTPKTSVSGVSVAPKTLSMQTGNFSTLTATVSPSNATDKSVRWESSNIRIATVDSGGRVKAVGAGTTQITVYTNDGNKHDYCTVTVTEPVTHPSGVTLNVSSLSLYSGESYTLIATVLPSNATDKSVTWSSSNPSVATVNSNGRVTVVGGGTATITVRTNDGGKTAKCVVTGKIHVTSVSLNRPSLSLYVGQTYTLIPTVSPSNATDKSVTWSSSNTSVATVNSNGKVTIVGGGTATITVRTNDGGKTARCVVTGKVYVTSVVLDKPSLSLYVGETYTLVPTVFPSNATDKSVTWSSSNTSVATVNSNGKVTGIAPGSATITVRTNDGGKTASCLVTVSRRSFIITFNANGGSVSPSSMTFYVGVPLGTLPTPSRTNYTFAGWFTSSSGGTQITSSSVYNSANNFTAYAHWNASTVTVPNFSGQSIDTAAAWCNSHGISYSTNYGYMWNYGNNIVVSNSNANGQVVVGSSITLNVSRGAKPIAVGDYVYVSGYCYSNSGNGTQGAYLDGHYYILNIYNYGIVAHPFLVGPHMGAGTGWVSEPSVHQRSGNAWGGPGTPDDEVASKSLVHTIASSFENPKWIAVRDERHIFPFDERSKRRFSAEPRA